MSATGLQVFDRTLQITNIWLNEISEALGPDRKLAWAALGAVLRTLRDRLTTDESAHLGAELPLLVRGAFYDQYHPARQPSDVRNSDQFLAEVEKQLAGQRPVNVHAATEAVFCVLSRHLAPAACDKIRFALPQGVRSLWPAPSPDARPAGAEPGAADRLH